MGKRPLPNLTRALSVARECAARRGLHGWRTMECQVVRGQRDMGRPQVGFVKTSCDRRIKFLLEALREANVLWVPERRRYNRHHEGLVLAETTGLFVRVLEGAEAQAEEQRRLMMAYEHAEGDARAELERKMVAMDAAMEGRKVQ